MGNALVPCPSCRRHVRQNEGACHFCGSALPADLAAAPALRTRLPRGAVFAFASTMAVAGCGGSTEAPTEDAAVDIGGMDAAYGGPPVDTGNIDTGGNVPLYGAPADTGVTDSGAADTGPDDSGGGAALYGAPADAK